MESPSGLISKAQTHVSDDIESVLRCGESAQTLMLNHWDDRRLDSNDMASVLQRLRCG